MAESKSFYEIARRLHNILERFIYYIIALLALIMLFTVLLMPQGPVRDFALNLSSEFLGASLVFLLVSWVSKYDPDKALPKEQGKLLEEINENIKKSHRGRLNFLDRYDFEGPFEKFLESAESVDMLGVSLSGVIIHHEAFLAQKAKSGCKFRFLIIDPLSDAVGVTTGFWEQNSDNRKEDINRSIRGISSMLETDNAELRFLSVSLPYSIIMINPESPRGRIQVELYGYGVAPHDQPHFVLTQADDEKWYSYFREQFELLWKDAKRKN